MNCKTCGSELKLIPAGISKKTGKAYNSFNACPKGCRTSWDNPKPAQNSPVPTENKVDGNLMVFEEVQAFRLEFNQRMTNMANFLVEKLGEKDSNLPNIKDIPFG